MKIVPQDDGVVSSQNAHMYAEIDQSFSLGLVKNMEVLQLLVLYGLALNNADYKPTLIFPSSPSPSIYGQYLHHSLSNLKVPGEYILGNKKTIHLLNTDKCIVYEKII